MKKIANIIVVGILFIGGTSVINAQDRNKVTAFLKEHPKLAEAIRARSVARESLDWILSKTKPGAGEGFEAAYKAALKIMTDAAKLKEEQAKELYEIVFPRGDDWEAKYEAYLKENPGISKAVKGGKITKEKVIAGIKSRAGEQAPSEEEQLEALYQKLLREDRTLGRTPKAELMPRLKEMLKRGEGKNLRPEKGIRERGMTHGLYHNGLIESGQVERFDKDLKRLHDVGYAEMVRQEKQKDTKGERLRGRDSGRGGDRTRGDRERNRRERDRQERR